MNNLFYVRKSVGKNGKVLPIFKFRTMIKDTNLRLEELILEQGLSTDLKILNDPRITNTGKFLRKYWIDEIPQLFQVLLVQMSIIGIRPRDNNEWKLIADYIGSDELMNEAINYKPSLLPVSYAFKTNSTRAKLLSEFIFLEEVKEKPISTRIKYMTKVFYNIFFKGMRSE